MNGEDKNASRHRIAGCDISTVVDGAGEVVVSTDRLTPFQPRACRDRRGNKPLECSEHPVPILGKALVAASRRFTSLAVPIRAT